MFARNRITTLTVTLLVSVVLSLGFAATALADSGTTSEDTISVDGYVINHREQAVDGTEFVPHLTVEAVGQAGSYTAAVDDDGYFEFEDIPASDWNFRMQLPEGWDGIVPLADAAGLAETGLTTMDEDEARYRIVFKMRRVFLVTVLKWEELNDGTVQPGEGWEITAAPVGDRFVKAQTDETDETGRVAFTLTPGNWVITEKVKSGWRPVTPSRITLTLDEDDATGAMDPIIFKNLEPACDTAIEVQEIGFGKDGAGNDLQLGPLAGWSVTVRRADNSESPVTKATDGAGQAEFDLLPGVYTVEEQEMGGWDDLSDSPQTVILHECETASVLFQHTEVKNDGLTIFGSKTLRAQTSLYAGEPVGLSGWVITATLVGTDLMTTTVTDALGDYTFTKEQLVQAGLGFPGATIDVCEESRDEWVAVTPACVRIHFPSPIPQDYAGATVNFANAQSPTGSAARTVRCDIPAGSCRHHHRVARGETLGILSARYGTSVRAIAAANRIRDVNLVFVGQNLCIP